MKDKNKDTLIGVLIGIIIVLVIGCIVMVIKEERLEEKYDNQNYVDNSNTNINSDEDISGNIQENTTGVTNDKYISKQDAINIALKDLKLTEKDVYDLEVELERKYNNTVYEVNFDYKNLDYEYYINATNGNIVKSFSELD